VNGLVVVVCVWMCFCVYQCVCVCVCLFAHVCLCDCAVAMDQRSSRLSDEALGRAARKSTSGLACPGLACSSAQPWHISGDPHPLHTQPSATLSMVLPHVGVPQYRRPFPAGSGLLKQQADAVGMTRVKCSSADFTVHRL
jgi:hypothetical protein